MEEEDESYIVRAPDVVGMIKTRDDGALTQFLKDPRSFVAGVLIETFSRGPSAFTGSLVKVGIAALSGRALEQFAEEIKYFRAKGKMAEDWAEKPRGYQTWVELLRVIDEESPDEEKLDALKAMFFAVNRVNGEDGERILAYQLFQIAKGLNSNELLVVKVTYALSKEGRGVAENQRGGWHGLISERLGHSVDDLVVLADKALVENKLLYGTPSGMERSAQGRLTQLGRKFCENIQQYQTDKKC